MVLLLDIYFFNWDLSSRLPLKKQALYCLRHISIYSISMLASFLSLGQMLAFH
jgi:hypothetical protein